MQKRTASFWVVVNLSVFLEVPVPHGGTAFTAF